MIRIRLNRNIQIIREKEPVFWSNSFGEECIRFDFLMCRGKENSVLGNVMSIMNDMGYSKPHLWYIETGDKKHDIEGVLNDKA